MNRYVWIAALAAAPVVADTVITYDDGSTLTTKESVYVTNEKVYTKVEYARFILSQNACNWAKRRTRGN